jgi:hypothetical protein
MFVQAQRNYKIFVLEHFMKPPPPVPLSLSLSLGHLVDLGRPFELG